MGLANLRFGLMMIKAGAMSIVLSQFMWCSQRTGLMDLWKAGFASFEILVHLRVLETDGSGVRSILNKLSKEKLTYF